MEACFRCLWCKSLMINNSVSARRHLPGLDVSILCSLWCYDKYRCLDQSGKSAWMGQGTWDDENENRRCALLSHPALEMTACTEWLSSVRLVEVCKWKQPPMFFVTQYLRKSYQNTVMPCCSECFAASPLHLWCLWTCPDHLAGEPRDTAGMPGGLSCQTLWRTPANPEKQGTREPPRSEMDGAAKFS